MSNMTHTPGTLTSSSEPHPSQAGTLLTPGAGFRLAFVVRGAGRPAGVRLGG